MKISINDQPIMTVQDYEKKVIAYDIHKDIVEDDIVRRIEQCIYNRYLTSFKNLKKDWDHVLMSRGIKNLPSNEEEYSNLVFAQPDYKDKAERLKEI